MITKKLCPCIDCITLGICKTLFKNKENDYEVWRSLRNKCILLRDFTGYKAHRWDEASDCLKGIKT